VDLLHRVNADGVARAAAAASTTSLARFVLISAYGADRGGAPGYHTGWWTHHHHAEAQAEAAVSATDWTILRPAGPTTAAATGLINPAEQTEFGQTPRADVADAVAAILQRPAAQTARRTWEIVSGPHTIAEAIGAAAHR
jgi:nucleoside-diphosphate-sugar epimerase